mgnify:FL=1
MMLHDRIVIAQHVVARKVGDEIALLDLDNGTYFGLNEMGSRIWELIADGKSLSEICDLLLAEFDVVRDILDADVRELARELNAKGLIRIGED